MWSTWLFDHTLQLHLPDTDIGKGQQLRRTSLASSRANFPRGLRAETLCSQPASWFPGPITSHHITSDGLVQLTSPPQKWSMFPLNVFPRQKEKIYGPRAMTRLSDAEYFAIMKRQQIERSSHAKCQGITQGAKPGCSHGQLLT